MANPSVSLPPRRIEPDAPVRLDPLSRCVRRLAPATRALLDLSVRRGVRDDQMAPLLRTDPFHLAWRRARALERVATEVGGDEPLPLAQVRAALETLPREAWDPLSVPALPRRASEPAEVPDAELVEDAEVVHGEL